MKRPRTTVSDHAVVRYLERVAGFDIDRLRIEIGRRVEAGALVGASAVKIDGFTYRIQNGVVTTIMPSDAPLDAGAEREPPEVRAWRRRRGST